MSDYARAAVKDGSSHTLVGRAQFGGRVTPLNYDEFASYGASMVERAMTVIDAAGKGRLGGAASIHGWRVDRFEALARVSLAASQLDAAGVPSSVSVDRLAMSFDALAGDVGISSPTESPQVLVDLAAFCLADGMWKQRWFDSLSPSGRDTFVRLLRSSREAPRPDNNWWWFHAIAALAAISVEVGGDWAANEVDQCAYRIEQLYRGGGWYSDGPRREFDFYNSFAFHHYPYAVQRAFGVSLPAVQHARTESFNNDLLNLIDSAGRPIAFGRSLTYRSAVATSLAWEGTWAASESRAAQVGVAVRSVVAQFSRGEAEASGFLSRGWASPDDRVAQGYSGPGASYWSSKVLVALTVSRGSHFWEANVPQIDEAESPCVDIAALGGIVQSSHLDSSAVLHAHNLKPVEPGDGWEPDPTYSSSLFHSRAVPFPREREGAFTPHVDVGALRYRPLGPRKTVRGPDWVSSVSQSVESRRLLPRTVFGRNLGRLYGRRGFPSRIRVEPSVTFSVLTVAIDNAVFYFADVQGLARSASIVTQTFAVDPLSGQSDPAFVQTITALESERVSERRASGTDRSALVATGTKSRCPSTTLLVSFDAGSAELSMGAVVRREEDALILEYRNEDARVFRRTEGMWSECG